MREKYNAYVSEYLQDFKYATKEELAFIRPHINIQEYGKRSFYLKEGFIQREMGYVSEGLLRRYYINQKGRDITTGFIMENEYVTDYPAFLQQRQTKYYIQCLEPTVTLSLPYDKIMESYQKFSNGQMYGRLIAEKALNILTDRVESFLFNTEEERYLKFIQNNPELTNRISLTHLSSFLGVERQSLSRIRGKLVKK